MPFNLFSRIQGQNLLLLLWISFMDMNFLQLPAKKPADQTNNCGLNNCQNC